MKALIEQSAEEPCYYAQLPQAKWPPTPQKDQTGGLFAKILDRDECGATPHNSDASVVGETDLPGELTPTLSGFQILNELTLINFC